MKEPYILINRKTLIAEIKHKAQKILDTIDLCRLRELSIVEGKIKKLNPFQLIIEKGKKFFDSGLLHEAEQIHFRYAFQEKAAEIALANKSQYFMKLNEFVCKYLYLDDLWYSSTKYTA